MAGRTKIRLAKLLTQALVAAGYSVGEIDPDALTEALGYHRTSNSAFNEALRWECTVARVDLPNLNYWITSFATMSEIVRSGGVALSADGTQIWADAA